MFGQALMVLAAAAAAAPSPEDSWYCGDSTAQTCGPNGCEARISPDFRIFGSHKRMDVCAQDDCQPIGVDVAIVAKELVVSSHDGTLTVRIASDRSFRATATAGNRKMEVRGTCTIGPPPLISIRPAKDQ